MRPLRFHSRLVELQDVVAINQLRVSSSFTISILQKNSCLPKPLNQLDLLDPGMRKVARSIELVGCSRESLGEGPLSGAETIALW